EDGIRDFHVTGVQTCALPISPLAPLPEGEDRKKQFFPSLSPTSPPFSKGVAAKRRGDFRSANHIFSPGSFAACFTQEVNSFSSRSEERRVGKESRSRWSAHAA